MIRHGDRGPLQHIRNISSVNCGARPNVLLNTYQVISNKYMFQNMT